MYLKAIKIKNFRCYKNETVIQLNNLTALIGKNDAGKSSILEALEIFFNNTLVKLESDDLNVDSATNGENKIEITGVFTDLPKQLIIDAANPTTLEAEYLLNKQHELEIKKVYICSSKNPREQVFIIANHPTAQNGNDLLLLKRQELKQRAIQLGIPPENYNANLNSSLRAAIWNHLIQLDLATVEIQVDKEDTKKAWDYISKWMPQFALFKSDRESSDGDKEVTDPMKVAINIALEEVRQELSDIQLRVMERAIEVANRTLIKLKEMNPVLANELTPNFKSEPKWSGLFGLTLSSDRNIPINKRGSGVRRLIVLNFFRAEAERRRNDFNSQAILYAFEEPENSQHPDHQKMLINAFKELSESDNTQVILTTHNPALAGLINEDDLRLITANQNMETTVCEQSDVLRKIANTLGMLPEPLKPKLLFCVEGPNDVKFWKIISALIHNYRPDLPDLSNDMRVSIFPLGGGTLKDWVTQDYLKSLNIPQYHIYDLDNMENPPYLTSRDQVRQREQDWAELTNKREIENYLHYNAIRAVYNFDIQVNDMTDVPEEVAKNKYNSIEGNSWETLDADEKKKKISRAKKRLNTEVAQQMTWLYLQESDPNNDIITWLEAIKDRIE